MKIRRGENLSRLTNMKKLSQNLIHNVTSIMTVSDINYLLLYLIILLTLSIKQPEKKTGKRGPLVFYHIIVSPLFQCKTEGFLFVL